MNAVSKARVNFFLGWPNHSLLPAALLKFASSSALSAPQVFEPGLEYGPDWGYEPLRQRIGQWLTRFYAPKDQINAERLCISGGASQNLACILQTFTDPVYRRNVWMVAPTYHMACRIFEDSGFAGKLRAVPEDDEGIDIDFLTKQIAKSEEAARSEGNLEPKLKPVRPWRKIYKHVIYAVPTFANPTSRLMSLRRRQELVGLARKYDALIITDDVYEPLQWSATPGSPLKDPEKAALPRLVDIDRFLDGGPQDEWGNAVSNGSFSKLLGPGCRTGWAEGTEKFAFGLSQTYVSSLGCSGGTKLTCLLKVVLRVPAELHRNWWPPSLTRSSPVELLRHTFIPFCSRPMRLGIIH